MFYYVIYNSTVLNYSNNNKKLNTFIYGTVLYILSHGLINSYDNKFAKYIKNYFWVVLAIDIFSIYYMYTYIDNGSENETDSLKALLSNFYNNTSNIKKSNNSDDEDGNGDNNGNNNGNKNEDPNHEKKQDNKKDSKKNNKNVIKSDIKEDSHDSSFNQSSQEPLPYFQDDLYSNNITSGANINGEDEIQSDNDISDQMSDTGSDIDLDKFEESLH